MYFLTKTDLNVLKSVIRGASQTIRQLAVSAGQDYKIVYFSVKKLAANNILKIEKKSNLSLCSPVLTNRHFSSALNSIAQEYLEKNKDIALLLGDIANSIKTPFYIMLLFGSVVQNSKKAGDLDIAFITPDKKFESQILAAVKSAQRKSERSFHNLVFTDAEFCQMLEEKQINVGKEIVKNCIVLYGSEAYLKILADFYG